jgi:chromosome segregation ATPase
VIEKRFDTLEEKLDDVQKQGNETKITLDEIQKDIRALKKQGSRMERMLDNLYRDLGAVVVPHVQEIVLLWV